MSDWFLVIMGKHFVLLMLMVRDLWLNQYLVLDKSSDTFSKALSHVQATLLCYVYNILSRFLGYTDLIEV